MADDEFTPEELALLDEMIADLKAINQRMTATLNGKVKHLSNIASAGEKNSDAEPVLIDLPPLQPNSSAHESILLVEPHEHLRDDYGDQPKMTIVTTIETMESLVVEQKDDQIEDLVDGSLDPVNIKRTLLVTESLNNCGLGAEIVDRSLKSFVLEIHPTECTVLQCPHWVIMTGMNSIEPNLVQITEPQLLLLALVTPRLPPKPPDVRYCIVGFAESSHSSFKMNRSAITVYRPLLQSLFTQPVKGFIGITSSNEEMQLLNGEESKLYDVVTGSKSNITGFASTSIISKAFWIRIKPLLSKGYKSALQIDEIPYLSPQHRAKRMSSIFESKWPKSDERSKHPVRTTLLRVFWREIAFTVFLAVIRLSFMFVGHVLLQSCVDFSAGKGSSPYEGYYIVLTLLCAKIVEVLTTHHFNFKSQKLGMLIRCTLITSLYKKGLRLTCSARQEHGVRPIVNYMAVDAQQQYLKHINLEINKGKLTTIVGTVGSGKLSLLASILGQMHKISRKVHNCGITSYVAQTAWIQIGTIEENIIFGLPINRQKYNDLLNYRLDFSALVAAHETSMELVEQGTAGDNLNKLFKSPKAAPNHSKEEKETGHVSLHIYKLYCTEAFGWWGVTVVVLFYVLWQASMMASDYWLAYETSVDRAQSFDPSAFISIYVIIAVVLVVLIILRTYFITVMGLKTAPVIHHFSESISGVMTIRAFKKKNVFTEENVKHVNDKIANAIVAEKVNSVAFKRFSGHNLEDKVIFKEDGIVMNGNTTHVLPNKITEGVTDGTAEINQGHMASDPKIVGLRRSTRERKHNRKYAHE